MTKIGAKNWSYRLFAFQKIWINTILNGYPGSYQRREKKNSRKLKKGTFFCSIKETESLSTILFRFDHSGKNKYFNEWVGYRLEKYPETPGSSYKSASVYSLFPRLCHLARSFLVEKKEKVRDRYLKGS